MAYTVKELFYTLQGEGARAGRAAVFVRFTGCNLWNGREADRERGAGGCARWCDTDFVGTDGDGGGRFATAEAVAGAAASAWGPGREARYVVCTGGEPLLQLDEALIEAFHREGFEVAIETNGTLPVPPGVDWVCVSPKAGSTVVVRSGHELKLVIPQEGVDPVDFEGWSFERFFVQPCDGLLRAEHTRRAIDWCRAHPRWRLSLQTHKLLGIP